jgi:lysozyme family protein
VLDKALNYILAHEGGFVNHPADRGGKTKYGITERTLASARQTDLGKSLPAAVEDLTKDHARIIYTALYWQPSHAQSLPWPLSYLQLDAAVQHGPGQAIRLLQAALGVVVDGRIGPITMRAMMALPTQPVHVVQDVADRMLLVRAIYYIRILRDPSQAVFASGWANRLTDVARKAGVGV